MSLPFLDTKKAVSVIMARRGKSDVEVTPEIEAPGQEMDAGLKEAAADVLGAIERKSVIDLAKALYACFQIAESMPHEENPEE